MAFSYVDIAIFFTAFVLGIYYYGVKKYDYFKDKGVKSLKPSVPFFGSSMNMLFRQQHFIDFALENYNACGDDKYIGLFEGQKPLIFVKDTELIKSIGIKDFDHFHNHHNILNEDVDPLFGNSLVFLQNEKWRDMRATLSPAFTSSKMRNMFGLINDCAKDFASYYIEEAKTKNNNVAEIDAKDSFTRYTNDVIASSAFGITINSLKNKDHEFYKLGKIASDFSGVQLFKFAFFAFFPRLSKFLNISFIPSRVVSFFREIVQCTMKSREKTGVVRHDMINLLMEAKKGSLKHDTSLHESETGFATVEESTIGKQSITRKWSDDELTAQALIFFLGGFETTSTLIVFFFYEMVRNPDIQTKLQEEIDNFNKTSGENVTYADIQHLKYLDMTISETLRMWPPGIITDRVCSKDYTLPPANTTSNQTYQIKKGESVWIPIYGLHHDPNYYPNPEQFDPERFSDENKSSIDPMTYLPFGVGPRNCIGSRFALLVGKLIAFHTLAKFDIVATEDTQIPIKLSLKSLNLLPKDGLSIGLKLRNI